MKEVNLFLIWTEYHLFTTISLISEFYNNSDEFENIIIHPSRHSGSRISNDLTIDFNATFTRLICVEDELEVTKTLKGEIAKVLAAPISRLITFHEEKPLGIYFIYKLQGKASIILAPDGNKPYVSWDKLSSKRRIKKTLKMHLWLWMHGLYVWKIYPVNKTYASYSEVDEVLITEPNLYKNTTNKLVHKLDILHSQKARLLTNRVFNFQFDSIQIPKSNIIFYINNNYPLDEAYEVELEIMQELKKKFPDNKLVIKPHPHTPESQITAFEKMEVTFIRTRVPAELFIVNLVDSIILSFWSAGLMIDNSRCNFYWMYPIMKRLGVLSDEFSIINPTTHINVVSDVDTIEFPSTAD